MLSYTPKLFTTLKDYTKEQLTKDIIAGVIVAIVALPLSIALAIASGVSPEKGLYTAIIAGFLISMLGGSRVQIGGPTGAFMIIVYGIVTQFGIEGLVIATIMSGIIMILLGVFRLGNIIKFIPYPVTTGFTSGIAVVIFTSQIKDLFGLDIGVVPVEFIDKWRVYIGAINTINIETTLIGILALIIILVWPKINRKIPGALIALIVTSILVKFLHLDVSTIGTRYDTFSSALPTFQKPQITWDKVTLLISPAFTIAILGSIESLLSAVVSDGMIGGKHRSNMELIAQGIANIASALFGGIPATGAIARTVANIKNGARTPVAGMVHSITLLLILVLFMPLVKVIPLTSLAAVLVVVAYNMSEWKEFVSLFKAPKSDIIVLLIVFFLTVFVDLVVAIEIGMVFAAILFMKRMAAISNVKVIDMDKSEDSEDNFNFMDENRSLQCPEYVQIYEINGPFFFGAADKFIESIDKLMSKTKVLIIRMRNVPSMDATALQAFKSLLKKCKTKKVSIIISGINEQPHKVLVNAGIYDTIGKENFIESLDKAIELATIKNSVNVSEGI